MPNAKKRAEKADAASDRKNAATAAKKAAEEDASWAQGAKGAGKGDRDAEKRADAQRKKDEKAQLAAAEDAENTKINKGGPKGKAAAKKSNGIDDFLVTAGLAKAPPKKQPGLAAANIEDAIDALSLANKKSTITATDIDKHPERRYKAAYAAFEERRIAEMKEEGIKLRLQQMKELCHKEFQKHPDNPFNQVTARHDASKEELQDIVDRARSQTEARLAVK